ncbi:MAG TPA: hypothetical protein PKK45_08820 [Leptospiraceae bacterium]|nr:hypothetical protein [Leptospiraceae bacterium]HNN58901.1 hypothetical protein [Leptospiraceae bacterium]
MIPRIEKTETRPSITRSRFDFGVTKQAIERLNEIAKLSNKKTETEKQINRIRYSISNDFKPGFRSRKHQDDARSIAQRQIEWLTRKVEAERQEVKVAQLRAEVEIIRELLVHKERELAAADNSRGSGLLHKRNQEIKQAQERAQRRAG